MSSAKTKEFKRIQHFIPRFLLEYFVSSNGKFEFIDKRYGSSNKTPGGAMYKELFYEHDKFSPNEIEDLLASRENFYSPIIKKIINNEQITSKEFSVLLEFRHVSYYRSNEFYGFYDFKKSRGKDDWIDRWDWRSLNAITGPDYEKQYKLAQLKAIRSVVNNDGDLGNVVRKLSSMTPICFLFISKNKKFVIGDNGSLSLGDEFGGVVIIVLSPSHALMFPKLTKAVDLMGKYGMRYYDKQHKIIYEYIDDTSVDFINKNIIRDSFEYYIDPN